MLGWWLGTGIEETRRGEGDQEPPETPAPVFAARAFKSALFGTPAPPADDTNLEQFVEPTNMTAPKQISKSGLTSPSKPQGILMTPGTARSRKTVSFGAAVKDQEVKPTSNSGIPDNCPGKFPSPWVAGDSNKVDGRSLRRTALTKTLENARDAKRKRVEEARSKSLDHDTPQSLLELDTKTGLTAPQILGSSQPSEDPQPRPWSSSRDTEDFDGDVTTDLNEPHSQSGRYWKAEYLKYNEDAKAQMTKLVKYKQMAKSYAKKKDEEAIDLGSKLKEAQERALQMEDRIAELVAQIAEGCMGGLDEDSPTMMKNLAKQTALAVQYRSQVDEFRDALRDREQKQGGGNGDQLARGKPNEGLEALLRKSQREVSKLHDKNGRLARELERANEKLSQSEKRRQASESTSQDRAQLLQGLQTNYDNLKESAKAQRRDAEHLLKKRHDQVSELKKEIAALKERLAASRVADQTRNTVLSEKGVWSRHGMDSNDGDSKSVKAQFKPTSQAGGSMESFDSVSQERNVRRRMEEANKPVEIYEDPEDREILISAESTLRRRRSATAAVRSSVDRPRHLRSKSDALTEIANNTAGSLETRQIVSDLSLRERFAKFAVDYPKTEVPRPFLGQGLRRTPSQKQATPDLRPPMASITQETVRPAVVRPLSSGMNSDRNRLGVSRLSSITSTRSRTALDPERAAAAKARLELRNAEKRRARELSDRKENVVI